MAQVLSFNGMPNIPGFQFWATRNVVPAGLFLAPPPGFQGPGAVGWLGWRFYFVECVANTAHAMLGKVVIVNIATTTNVSFEFTEGGLPTPPNNAVVIANGDSAAVCATALADAIMAWAAANMPFAVVASTGTLGAGAVVTVVSPEPQVPVLVVPSGPLPRLFVTNNGGRVYGDMLLHRASRAFVYTGYDPAGVSVFPVGEGGVGPDIALMFWPLTPVIPKAFPGPILNPAANEPPRG